MIRILLGLVALFIGLGTGVPHAVHASTTIYVPDNYPTIQAAVDATSTGDTIIVKNGTYIENVYVDKDHLTIRSENGADFTLVQAASPDNNTFHITSDNVTVAGFSIKGATEGWHTAGIRLYQASYCNILDNEVTQNICGIMLRDSSNNTIAGNSISSNTNAGLDILDSDDNQFIENTCTNNQWGINMRDASNNLFRNNHFSGNHYNLDIEGMGRIHYPHDIDTSNTVDGKPIIFWVNEHDKQVPTNAGYVAILHSDNITIKDLTLANNETAVSLGYSTNCKVENLTISNCGTGIGIYRSSHNAIRANHINSLSYCGIRLCTDWTVIGSDYNTIAENVISNCYYGVALGSVSRYNLVTKNTIISNNHGVSIDVSHPFDPHGYNIVSNNIIAGNYSGTDWGTSGILLRGTTDNTILENIIMYNESGVLADDGTLNHSFDNVFYNNDFIDNVSQTYNFQAVNIWDNGLPSGGNYWSDYTGEDANDDGIGDIPYEIVGGVGGVDNYPLMESRWKQSTQNVAIILAASPKSITATGSSTSTITATVKDDHNNNVPDDTVVVFATSAGSIGSTTAIALTTNGIATATLTSSTTTGVATVTTTVGGATAATAVFFTRPGVTVTDFIEEKTSLGQYTVDAKSLGDIEVTKWGDGTPTVTVAKYSGNPAGPNPGGFSVAGDYVDVHLSSTDNVTQIEIRKYYTDDEIRGMSETTLRVHWWSGSGWVECSNSGVNTNDVNGYSGYVWAIITDDTTPNLADLSGGMFAAMGATTIVSPAPTAPSTSSGPRASPTPPRPLNPAQISVQYLNVNPQQAQANQPVTITTNVVNTGDEAGNYNVALKINGQTVQQKMVSVGAQGTQPVKFTITRSQPGTYIIDIGGQKGSFTIAGHSSGTAGQSTSSGLIVLVLMGVLLLATVVVLLISFRRG